MMTLITGMPGNGKTLYAVNLIYEARQKKQVVYSDIRGLKIEGVLPAPDDWRECPPGSLVVYDEAHQRFPAFKGKGRSPLEVVQRMDEHRGKYGLDLVFITQWPDKMDGELFRLIGEHYHLNRAMGLQKASVVKFSRAMMNPYSATARKGADEELWDYPKARYADYDSSINHTGAHKFKLPKKVKNALLSIPFVLLALWGVYAFFLHQFGISGKAERSEAEPTTTPRLAATANNSTAAPQGFEQVKGTGEYAALASVPVPVIAGCVVSDRGCRCFADEGQQIDQTQSECLAVMERPLPFNIFHQYAKAATNPQDNKGTPERGAGDSPADTPSSGAVISSGLYDVQGRELVYRPGTAG